jgi:hypothetical protein
MGKLAFLFLIYDEINHEDILKHFFENVPSRTCAHTDVKNPQKPIKYARKS